MAAPLPLTQGAPKQPNCGTRAPVTNDLVLTGGLAIPDLPLQTEGIRQGSFSPRGQSTGASKHGGNWGGSSQWIFDFAAWLWARISAKSAQILFRKLAWIWHGFFAPFFPFPKKSTPNLCHPRSPNPCHFRKLFPSGFHNLRIYPYPMVWPLPRPWSETMVSIPL